MQIVLPTQIGTYRLESRIDTEPILIIEIREDSVILDQGEGFRPLHFRDRAFAEKHANMILNRYRRSHGFDV